MKEFLRKLTSRKLWLAIAGVATGIAIALGADANEIGTISGAVVSLVSAVTYIITEGKIDAEGVKNAIVGVEDIVEILDEAVEE